MTLRVWRTGWGRACAGVSQALLLAGLVGCGLLPASTPPPEGPEPGPVATPADAATAPEAPAERPVVYRLEVQAPDDGLRKLLATHLDLARFQTLQGADAITLADLDRLVRAAPAQARALLETEGHFNAQVTARRLPPGDDGRPRVRVQVTPGPRAEVAQVALDVQGPLQQAVQAGDTGAQAQVLRLRQSWALGPGQPFRQAPWSDAKNAVLTALRADGYPLAAWARTQAQVDAADHRAALSLLLDSGPLFHFGEVRPEGLQRYSAPAVVNLRTFGHGERYSEKALLDFQDRLQRVGLFESAAAEIDTDPAAAAASPVRVRVRELPQHQAEFGAGFSDLTGPRVSVTQVNRRVFDRPFFGTDWVARHKLEFGRDRQSLETDLTSHPLEGGYRHLLAGKLQHESITGATITSGRLRAGRTVETERIERLQFVEFVAASTRNDSDPVAPRQLDRSLTGNLHATWRRVDSVLQPTRGLVLHGEFGAGYATSTVAQSGPFVRSFGRLAAYRPLGGRWLGSARLDAGQVFARAGVGVPDTLLFRAGGDDSVRGYEPKSLGPEVNGAVTSGRVLLAGSLEAAHPVWASLPTLLGAVFVDAGSAANHWGGLHPVLGYGVGLRLRTPVGPLRLDLAYGQAVQRTRVHFGVGIAF